MSGCCVLWGGWCVPTQPAPVGDTHPTTRPPTPTHTHHPLPAVLPCNSCNQAVTVVRQGLLGPRTPFSAGQLPNPLSGVFPRLDNWTPTTVFQPCRFPKPPERTRKWLHLDDLTGTVFRHQMNMVSSTAGQGRRRSVAYVAFPQHTPLCGRSQPMHAGTQPACLMHTRGLPRTAQHVVMAAFPVNACGASFSNPHGCAGFSTPPPPPPWCATSLPHVSYIGFPNNLRGVLTVCRSATARSRPRSMSEPRPRRRGPGPSSSPRATCSRHWRSCSTHKGQWAAARNHETLHTL